MSRRYRWRFHFNAMHNMTPEREEGRHPHSFLVIWCMETEHMDLEQHGRCEKELKQYLEQYSGKNLNELPEFSERLPDIEAICEKIYRDTEKIAAAHGMKQIQVEVGDSPVARFSLGKKLLIGDTYTEIRDEIFQKYRGRLQGRKETVQG